MTQQEPNIKALEAQGFTNVEGSIEKGYWFESDGYDYYVLEAGEDALNTLAMATLYSPCCGEYVDQDWMICPCCKEHV